MTTLASHFDINHTSLGGGASFDPARTPLRLPDVTWLPRVVSMRAASAVPALLPLLAAVLLFHRFSPDKVKVSSSRRRRSPPAMLDGWLRPLSRLVQPLFTLAAWLPRWCRQVLADVVLTLAVSRSAIAALVAALAASVLVGSGAVGLVLAACTAAWTILVSDTSTRDFQAVKVPMLDAVGFNGAANMQSVLAFLAIGTLALVGGYVWNRRH